MLRCIARFVQDKLNPGKGLLQFLQLEPSFQGYLRNVLCCVWRGTTGGRRGRWRVRVRLSRPGDLRIVAGNLPDIGCRGGAREFGYFSGLSAVLVVGLGGLGVVRDGEEDNGGATAVAMDDDGEHREEKLGPGAESMHSPKFGDKGRCRLRN